MQSANLTRVLRLNPQAVVVPLEHDHLQLTLIDPALPLPDLQRIALTNRPDLASQRALVQAAEERIRREKMRPFLPIVVLGGFQNPGGMMTQAGIFGLGPNSSLNQWTGRDRRELSARLAVRCIRHRQPRADQAAARRSVGDLRRSSTGPRTWSPRK